MVNYAPDRLLHNFERLFPIWTVAIDREVIVEARGACQAESSHHSEARSIHDGEVLVGKCDPNLPGHFNIRERDDLDLNTARQEARQESIGEFFPMPTLEQQPRLDKDVIARHMSGRVAQNRFGAPIATVPL